MFGAGRGPQQARPAVVAPSRLSPQLVTAPFDPTVGAALAATGIDPTSPSYLDQSLAIPLQHDSTTARRQDALGSMLWLGLNPDNTPRTQILMPPLAWNLQQADAQAILTALATTIHAGLAVPRPLTAVIADAEATAGPARADRRPAAPSAAESTTASRPTSPGRSAGCGGSPRR